MPEFRQGWSKNTRLRGVIERETVIIYDIEHRPGTYRSGND